jgi:hypothetical protein
MGCEGRGAARKHGALRTSPASDINQKKMSYRIPRQNTSIGNLKKTKRLTTLQLCPEIYGQ